MNKKTILIIIICTLFLGNVYADELSPDRSGKISQRAFEIGINAGAGFSNNLLTLRDFTSETLQLDIAGLADSLNFGVNLDITPFYLIIGNFYLSVNVNGFGNIGLSNSLISLSPAEDDISDANFAVFADISLNFPFKISNFNFNLRASAFYALAYSKPEISYTYNSGSSIDLELDFDIRIFTALNFETLEFKTFNFFPGLDFSIGVEYPLSRALGIYKAFALFDFDVGLDIQNITVLPYTMNHYMQLIDNGISISGSTMEELLDEITNIDFENLIDEPEYGEDKITVERPFRMNLYIRWRIFGRELFTLTPNIGFSVNPMYLNPFSWEYGIKAKLDLGNFFVLLIGANYEDRIWKNRADIALNFRLFEINAALELRTNEFFRFLNTSGAGVYVGFKFGF